MTEIATNFREEKKPSFNIRLFLLQYVRAWYWFIPTITLTVGVTYLYLRYTAPTYLVTAAILIKERPDNTGYKLIEREADDPRGSQIENEVEVLKSKGLMLRVVDALNLTVRYYRKGFFARDEEIYDTSPVWIYAGKLTPDAYKGPIFVKVLSKQQYELLDKEENSKGKYFFNQEIKSQYGSFRVLLKDANARAGSLTKVRFYTREQTAQTYQALFRVASSLSSAVLKLYLEESVPARGKIVVDKILEFYTQLALEDKNLEAKYALRFIDERLRVVRGELNSVEKNFESYKNSRGVTDLSSQAGKFLEAVSISDQKLNQIDLDLRILDEVENYLKTSQSGSAPALQSLSGDPVLKDQLQKLGGLQSQYEKYSRTMQSSNPFLQGIIAQIESTKNDIRENITNQRRNLEISRSSFKQFNDRSESSMRAVPKQERELLSIQRQQAVKQEVYLLLLRKKEELEVIYASAVTDSRIIDYASSTSGPLRPSKANAYLVALLLGLLIPIGGVTLKARLNNKIGSRNEIENETGLTVFGEIIRKPQLKNGNSTAQSIEADKIIAEQFKLLRANLPYADGLTGSTKSQIILITSSISGEGKSFFSINLSTSLAQLDKRVVVVESDMRRPKTTNYLGMSNEDTVGLADYLSGHCEIHDLLRTTDQSNLYLISSGHIPNNPAELLSNRRLDILLHELRQRFDYIILDTPPVSFVADTTLLAPHVDKVFYLVRHDYTPRNCLQLLTSFSVSQKFKSLNIIFNGVSYEQSKQVEYGFDYKQYVS